MERILFANPSGMPLVGILSGPAPPAPAVVLCHGFSSSKDGPTTITLADRLNNRGIATFRFDLFGHGESGGSFADITPREAMDDTLRAITVMKQCRYETIGLFGSSFGGLAALLAAPGSGIRCLALKAPVSDFAEVLLSWYGENGIAKWKQDGSIVYRSARGEFPLKYGFFVDAQKRTAFAVAPSIKVPILFVHGDQDQRVPLAQSQKIVAMMKNARLEVIPGAGHDFASPGAFEKMISLTEIFFRKHLKPISA